MLGAQAERLEGDVLPAPPPVAQPDRLVRQPFEPFGLIGSLAGLLDHPAGELKVVGAAPRLLDLAKFLAVPLGEALVHIGLLRHEGRAEGEHSEPHDAWCQEIGCLMCHDPVAPEIEMQRAVFRPLCSFSAPIEVFNITSGSAGRNEIEPGGSVSRSSRS